MHIFLPDDVQIYIFILYFHSVHFHTLLQMPSGHEAKTFFVFILVCDWKSTLAYHAVYITGRFKLYGETKSGLRKWVYEIYFAEKGFVAVLVECAWSYLEMLKRVLCFDIAVSSWCLFKEAVCPVCSCRIRICLFYFSRIHRWLCKIM